MIIDKCLRKNPDERYQHGAELAADLRRVIERMRTGGAAPAAPQAAAASAASVSAATTSAAPEKTVVLDSPQQNAPGTGPDGTLRIEPGSKS
jgi:hypothetical protein